MPTRTPPERKRPKDAPVLDWLQRINGKYSAILRWTGLIGMIVGLALAQNEMVVAFGGLFPMSIALGGEK